MDAVPEAGDVIWLDFDPQAGHEQARRRPALVLSPRSYQVASRLALVCPISRSVKGYPFEVPVPEETGLVGVVLADHLRSVDWQARRASVAGRAPAALVSEVASLIKLLIG